MAVLFEYDCLSRIMHFSQLRFSMDESYAKMAVEGGSNSCQQQLKMIELHVEDKLHLMVDDVVSVRNAQFKKMFQKCNAAKELLCRHFEDVKTMLKDLICYKRRFQDKTIVTLLKETQVVRVQTVLLRYSTGAKLEHEEAVLYEKCKKRKL